VFEVFTAGQTRYEFYFFFDLVWLFLLLFFYIFLKLIIYHMMIGCYKIASLHYDLIICIKKITNLQVTHHISIVILFCGSKVELEVYYRMV
jgi:hypothetical protein